jgi:hypothetical protein
MIDHGETLRRIAAADPVPRLDDIGETEVAGLLSVIEERRSAMTTRPGTSPAPRPARTRLRPALAFGAALVIVLAAIGATALLVRDGNGDVASSDPTTADVATTVQVPPATEVTETTATPANTAAPTTTSAPTTSAPAVVAAVPDPFSGAVSIDPEGTLQFGEPTPAFDSEGLPQILYAKPGATALAVCADPECSSVTIHELLPADGGLGMRVGIPRPGTGPVFWAGSGSEGMLVVCSDVACTDPTFHLRSDEGWMQPAIATGRSGDTLIVSYDRGGQPPALVVERCSEPSCTVDATEHVLWEPPADLWIGGVGAAIGDDGLPVVAIRTQDGILIGECAEADCRPPPDGSTFEPLADIPIADVIRRPLLVLGDGGAPMAVLSVDRTSAESETWEGEAVVVVACIDAACSDWVVTEVAEVGDMYSEWAVAAGPDGRLRIVWSEDGSTFLATCHDRLCIESSIVDTGHRADDVGLTFDGNGAPVIATMSRDAGLSLVFCGDDACRLD